MAENHQFAAFSPRDATEVTIPETLRALGLLALLLLAFYWKISLTGQYTWLDSPDLANQVLPWFQYQAGEIHRFRIPLWGMFEWGGQSLIGQAQPGVAYPPNWLMLGLRFDHGWLRQSTLHGYYLFIHLAAAFGMWRLCRDSGCSFSASLLGGFGFSAGGFVGAIDWPQMVNGAIWAPLVFMYHLRSVRTLLPWRAAGYSGLFLGLSWLSGHHQVPLFLSIAVITSSIYFSVTDGRTLPRFVLTLGVTGLIGALQILPAAEYGADARRWVGLADPIAWNETVPYHIHELYGFIPQSILGILIPGLAQNTPAFFGVAAALLAAWGGARLPYWSTLTAVGLLTSLAQFGGIHGLLYALVPGVEKARSPSMAVAIFSLGFCVLAAHGADRLRRAELPPVQWGRIAGLGGVLVLVGIWFTNLWRGQFPDQRLVLTGVLAVTAAIALRQPRGWLVLAAAGYLELGLTATHSWGNVYDPQRSRFLKPMAQHGDLAGFLASQAQPVRVSVDDQAVPYNFGDWHGVEVWGGYLASLSQNILNVDHSTASMRRLMSVTHSIGHKPLEEGGALVFRGKSGVNVYALPDPLPRVRLVHQVFHAPQLGDAQRLLRLADFDHRHAAVLPELPAQLEACSGGTAAVILRQSGRMVVAADAPCRSLLVMAETAAPGWTLRVDGRPAPLLTANLLQRAALAEKGWHVYEFRYQPRSVQLGALLALLGIGVVVFVSIMEPRWK